ncbi:hypothetical protein GCM10007392_05510 [Saccharospirillum salsuginis]|uniref:EAL domain-containing protein n=1 Tax=Saccharospirillum salsuginis TaxID=418750 RepID=A0A918N660_9GAMM|nr:hypothetical protein GCM10007392_05510 [Saccharospirillum salsuginis]
MIVLVLLPSLGIAEQMTMHGEADRYSLNRHIAYYVDTSGDMNLVRILQQDGWRTKEQDDVLNLGFTQDPLWIRTSLSLPETISRQWYLVIQYPLLEQADLYLLQDGTLPATYHISRRQVLEDQNHSHGYQIALPLPTTLSGNMELVLRVQSTTSLQVPLALWREDHLHSYFTQESLLWGGYFGILFALVVYNLFLFASIRDPAYGYYVLYLYSLVAVMLCVSGLGVTLLWSPEPLVTRYVLPISTGFLTLFAILFARAFLRWPGGVSRRLERSMRITAGLAVLLILYTAVNPIHGARLAGLLGALVLAMLIIAGSVRLRAGVVIARYFVAAWASFTLGAALYLLNVFDLIPVNAFTNHAIQVGSVAEVLLLSFALAHRIKEERAHKLVALERQHRAEGQVQKMVVDALENAVHDSVTKMPNAAMLNHRLQELLPGTRKIATVIVNYPQVRQIALSMGHSLAETMFRELANKLNGALANSGMVVCLEDKSAAHIATPELGSVAFLMRIDSSHIPLETQVEGLVGQCEVSVNTVKLPTRLNMHCGIALHPDHGSHATTLYKYAWAALDSSVRTQVPVQLYSQEISAFAERRLALMSALLPAIEAGEMTIYLQPQIDCATGSVVGAEVLLRWFSPEFGQVPTWEVIDIAENASLMDQVTRFVVIQTLETIQRFQLQNLDIRFSINLSVQNLITSDCIRFILDETRNRSIPLDRLVVEVTETAMMQKMDTVIVSLNQFTGAGGRVALDDFGTGYSSLAYLSRLPISELKIDKSFIRNMRLNKNDLWIVENTIKLAKTLNLVTVAEGIEDREALDLVRQLGCSHAQGYYFSRPMPVDEFCAWVREREAS